MVIVAAQLGRASYRPAGIAMVLQNFTDIQLRIRY